MKYYYPNRIIQSSNKNGKYVKFNDLDNIKNSDDTYAITDEIESKRGEYRNPSIIRTNKFNCDFPLNSRVNDITVEIAQENVGNIILNETIVKLLNVDFELKNSEFDSENKIYRATFTIHGDIDDINSPYFGVNITFPGNISENTGYLKVYFVRISVSYDLLGNTTTKLKRIPYNIKKSYNDLRSNDCDIVLKLYYIFKTIAQIRLDFMNIDGKKNPFDQYKEDLWTHAVNNYEKRDAPKFEGILEKRGDYKGWKLKLLRLDYMLCHVLIGAIPYDYFSMTFEEKGWLWRNHHITTKRLLFIVPLLNSPYEAKRTLRDKIKFCEIWNYSLHRKWCNPETTTIDEFVEEFKDIDRVIVKPRDDSRGRGIEVFDTSKTSLEDILKWTASQDGQHIIEEYHHQTGWLHEINPSSLNTIRLATLKFNGETKPLFSYVRFGLNNSYVDNLHSGGVQFPIDCKTGKIQKGMNYEIMNVERHPESNIKVAGKTMPKWDEIVQFCIDAHKLAPENLNLIGWDVCLDEDDISFIEANGKPGFPPIHNPKENHWKLIKQCIRELDKRQK